MSKIVAFNMVSANGIFERGPWGIDWHRVDAEFNDFANRQLDSLDTLLFGRVTYEGMAGYWSSAEAIARDPEVAQRMNAKPKIVFSRTLEKAAWQNTRIARDAAAEVAQLRATPGGEAAIFGSSDLVVGLSDLRLIDEYRTMIAAVAIGDGRPYLHGLTRDLGLRLLDVRRFGNGNVLLSYAPEAVAGTPRA
jgi:dihydrofolate reductase